MKRSHLSGLMMALCFCISATVPPSIAPPATQQDGISVYFSPKGGCSAAIIAQLNAAKYAIDMQAYSFTSTDIAAALAVAHDRGVNVRAILDRKENETGQYSGATYLFNHQVPTWTDGKHPIAHNKIIIVDFQTVITGSFNFTKQAEQANAENLLIITGKKDLASAYEKNFEAHLAHSDVYQGLAKGKSSPRSAPAREADDTQAEDAPSTQPASNTPTPGQTYVGPRGGVYHYSASGKKVYEKR